MHESKTTPGPWRCIDNPDPDGYCIKWINGPDGVPVAEVRHLAPGVGEANAALIASAPDLARENAALREALDDALGFVVQMKMLGQSGRVSPASLIPAPFALETKIRAALSLGGAGKVRHDS